MTDVSAGHQVEPTRSAVPAVEAMSDDELHQHTATLARSRTADLDEPGRSDSGRDLRAALDEGRRRDDDSGRTAAPQLCSAGAS